MATGKMQKKQKKKKQKKNTRKWETGKEQTEITFQLCRILYFLSFT